MSGHVTNHWFSQVRAPLTQGSAYYLGARSGDIVHEAKKPVGKIYPTGMGHEYGRLSYLG